MAWTPQNEAIFEWFEAPDAAAPILFIDARAGTGKTTTLVEGVRRAPERSILLAAFNRRIRDELSQRVDRAGAVVKTLHQLGHGIVCRAWGKLAPDRYRDSELAQAAAGDEAPRDIVDLVRRLASFAKNMTPLGDEQGGEVEDRLPRPEQLVELALRMDVAPDEDDFPAWPMTRFVAAARKALELAATQPPEGQICFDDQIWLPIVHGWARPQFDLVVIDEAQDMNLTQRMLARRLCRSRFVVAGDPYQGIYGWRGADGTFFEKLREARQVRVLPLTGSFRCPRQVVAAAQRLVADFATVEGAPEGVVRGGTEAEIVREAGPGDFVLSRVNRALPRICLQLLKAGKRAYIEGRDVGARLRKIVKGIGAYTVVDLLAGLERWQAEEVKRAMARPRFAAEKIEQIGDEADTIRALAEGAGGLDEVKLRIERLFSEDDGTPRITCSTVHRAKGLEADRVWLLTETLYPRDRHSQEEKNIHYVAITRAKAELVLVAGRGAPERAEPPRPSAPPSSPAPAPLESGKLLDAIVCIRGSGFKRCQEPGCGRPSIAACDWPLEGPAAGRTCDRRMCMRHRHQVGPNRDYCTPHYQRAQAAA